MGDVQIPEVQTPLAYGIGTVFHELVIPQFSCAIDRIEDSADAFAVS